MRTCSEVSQAVRNQSEFHVERFALTWEPKIAE